MNLQGLSLRKIFQSMKKEQRQPESGLLFHSSAAFFLILVNIAVYLFSHYTVQGNAFAEQMVFYSGNLLSGNFWCIFVSGFLHSSWQHLAFNMLGVFIFGSIVQQKMGFKSTMFVYFGAMFISMLASMVIYIGLVHKNVAIIGASGAVMGLMATAMLTAPFSITWEMLLPIPTMVKGWMFFYADLKGFLGGEADGVSHLAHLCGFLSVMILVYFVSSEDRKKLTAGFIINVISLAAAAWVRQKYFI